MFALVVPLFMLISDFYSLEFENTINYISEFTFSWNGKFEQVLDPGV